MKPSQSPTHHIDDWPTIVETFKRGLYETCVSQLQSTQSAKACALKARALIRLGREADALSALSSIESSAADAEVLGERDSLSSLALLRLGRFTEARTAQTSAREHLSTVTAWAIRSELRYHEACFHYAVGDFQKTYDTALESDREILSYYERSSHDVISVSYSRAALKNSAAAADLSRSRHTRALNGFIEALAICRSNPTSDVGGFSRILSNISGIMNEHGDRQADTLKIVLEAAGMISWTSELAREQFYILRELAYAFTLFGDFQAAFKTFNAAADCSTAEIDQLLSRADHIFVLRELGQLDIARQKLFELDESVRRASIRQCVEGDADALLMLGEHLAEVNLQTARSLQKKYLALKSGKIRLTTAFTEERFVAHSLRLESALAYSRGESNVARDFNRQAFDLYERLGNRWNAGRVALDLSITESARPYREYVRDMAVRWPNSSFAAKVCRLDPTFRQSIENERHRTRETPREQ